MQRPIRLLHNLTAATALQSVQPACPPPLFHSPFRSARRGRHAATCLPPPGCDCWHRAAQSCMPLPAQHLQHQTIQFRQEAKSSSSHSSTQALHRTSLPHVCYRRGIHGCAKPQLALQVAAQNVSYISCSQSKGAAQHVHASFYVCWNRAYTRSWHISYMRVASKQLYLGTNGTKTLSHKDSHLLGAGGQVT